MSIPIYELELKDIRWMVKQLNEASESMLVAFADGATVSLTVQRGEYGKITPAGQLVFDGTQWLFQG